jgi:phage-related protein
MKKTQAILKKLNIVASSLEEMSFLQESNEIHKVFINNANQALYQAKLKTQLYSELNFRNVGAVSKTLRNMLEKNEISRDAYFTAIEMARLSSVIMEK